MSAAQVTEAHRELARNIMFYHTARGSATAQGVRDAAQLIADSEARAIAELRTEAELATERARLDAVVKNCWLVHKGNENMFAVFSNECGDYITPWLETERAAIDAALKEDTK